MIEESILDAYQKHLALTEVEAQETAAQNTETAAEA